MSSKPVGLHEEALAEAQAAYEWYMSKNPAAADENTIEKEWGWVFFYTSDRYLKTGDFRYAVAGNAPYIVNRHTGEVRVTGTAQRIEHYIAEYERELAGR